MMTRIEDHGSSRDPLRDTTTPIPPLRTDDQCRRTERIDHVVGRHRLNIAVARREGPTTSKGKPPCQLSCGDPLFPVQTPVTPATSAEPSTMTTAQYNYYVARLAHCQIK